MRVDGVCDDSSSALGAATVQYRCMSLVSPTEDSDRSGGSYTTNPLYTKGAAYLTHLPCLVRVPTLSRR